MVLLLWLERRILTLRGFFRLFGGYLAIDQADFYGLVSVGWIVQKVDHLRWIVVELCSNARWKRFKGVLSLDQVVLHVVV